MTGLSLRGRVLLLITLLNALLFVGGGAYLRGRLGEADEQVRFLVEDVLGSGLRSNIDSAGDFRVGPILRYGAWTNLAARGLLEDVVLVGHRNLVRSGERVVAGGIDLNPLGSAHRRPDFDRQLVLGALLEAIETQTPVPAAGGRAVSIRSDGQVWGGVWYKVDPRVDFLGIFRQLLPLFLLSTLALTLGTFWVLREVVLDPVRQLAQGARRVGAGDLTVTLPEPDRGDELADLVRAFNQMTSTVRGFNETLEEEVRVATAKARDAEKAAMTQRRLAAMGELAAGIAHEINNPLGGMLNAVDVLSRADVPPDKRARYADLVARGLARIGETVSRLRRFTPREASKEPLDVVAVVEDALELVRHRADRLGVELAWVPPEPPPPPVLGARNEVGQALLNLLANALDALEEHGPGAAARPGSRGRVTVTLAEADDELHLAVEDDGPGVDEEELARIADLYYTTKEVGKGTGLGLALVHRALAELGGRVDLSSRPGVGLRAVLVFPLRSGGAPAGGARR